MFKKQTTQKESVEAELGSDIADRIKLQTEGTREAWSGPNWQSLGTSFLGLIKSQESSTPTKRNR